MNSKSDVIELNNQAVAFIKQNQLHNAISTASCALQYQRRIEMEHRADGQCSVAESCEGGDDCCIDQCMMHSDLNEYPCSPLSAEFVYQYGISLPSNGIDSAAATTAIVIFNLALSYHLLSRKHRGTKSQHLLQKSKRMYALAHNAHDSEENILFEFALINNSAVVLKAIGDCATANEYIDYLLSILMMFVDRGCSKQLRHVHGFLANMNADTETAPAA